MKQKFEIEIIIPPDTSRVSELRLVEAIRNGYKDHFGQELVNLFVSENNVEQTCGTPDNTRKQAFDLLREASDSLEDSEYHSVRRLSYKIQDFLVSKGESI